MKKLMMSIFIVTALASCSSENELIDDGGIKGDERVEIKLNAGVSNVETKAAITQWAGDEELTFYHPISSGYEAWKAKVNTTNDISFVDNAGNAMKRYYDINATNKTQLIGLYAPGATFNNGTVTIPLNGTDDIMATIKVEGDKDTQIPNVTFQHLLSQLVFNVKSTDGTTSMEVSSLVIKGNKGSMELTLDGFSTSALATPTFTEAAAGSSITVIGAATTIDDGIGSVLVAPNTSLTMDITVDGKEFKNIAIQAPATGFEATTSYQVDLTVTQKEVSVKATPGEWKTATDRITVPVEDPANNNPA